MRRNPIEIEAEEYVRLKEAEQRLRAIDREADVAREEFLRRARLERRMRCVFETKDRLESVVDFPLPHGDGPLPRSISRQCISKIPTEGVSGHALAFSDRVYRYDGPQSGTTEFLPRYVEE